VASPTQQIDRIRAIWDEHLKVAGASQGSRQMYPVPLTRSIPRWPQAVNCSLRGTGGPRPMRSISPQN